jgi:flagellar hook assembly protein FlgD/sugar lactone lactonase YvrE
MRQAITIGSSVLLLLVTTGFSGRDTSPERMGMYWAGVSDRARLEFTLDELNMVSRGARNERVVVGHFSGGVTTAHMQALRRFDMSSLQLDNDVASVATVSGGTVDFVKDGNGWQVSTVSEGRQIHEDLATMTDVMAGESVGATLIPQPLSRQHGIERLSRSVTESRIGRVLFGMPGKTASYYFAHYRQSAPYVDATYLQFVLDPEWERILYGNLDRWIRAYDNVSIPSGIAVDAEGRVFVSEAGKGRVSVLRISGSGEEARLHFVFAIEDMGYPGDLSVNDNGTPLDVTDDVLYVADGSRNAILKYQLGTAGASLIASFDGFDTPSGVAVGRWDGASTSLLYVIDRIAKRIRVYEDQGSSLALIALQEGDPSQYFGSMKVDHFGNVYVVDNVNSQILKFTSDLELLDTHGGVDAFTALGAIDIPFGKIVVDGQGTYWAGFDQLFAVERWAETSGAQRRVLGVGLKNIRFRADDDISKIESAFTLTDHARVDVKVYDQSNRHVRTIGSSWMVSGAKVIGWDRRDEAGALVEPGTYRFEIAGSSAYRDDRVKSHTRIYLPLYYHENSGAESPIHDKHLVQGNPVRWGLSPSETGNQHTSAVQYRFTGLNPASDYRLAAEFVAGDDAYRLQDITVDGIQIQGAAPVTRTPFHTGYVHVPKEVYADGEILVSINRQGEGSAIVSQLWLKETGRGFSAEPITHEIPTAYTLEQNYPNPFNPSTMIRYAIPEDVHVTLKVYDIGGREVATLVDAQKTAGFYEVRFESMSSTGNSLASGVYFYRITAGQQSHVRKMLLVR